jgi:CubicO group peptidase (beta-lactamase class C family)
MRYALALLLLAALTPVAPAAQSPDTTAGRRLRAYVDSFNSGDEKAVAEFITANMAKSALAARSLEERIARYREIRGALGGFDLRRVVAASATSISALARTRSGEMVTIVVDLEPEPPNGIVGIRIEPSSEPDPGPGSVDAAGTPPPSADPDHARIAARADEYLSRLVPFGFSGSALVAVGDRVVFDKAYGWADRTNHVANTTTTLFDVGSLGKQFTAAAVLKLEMMGKLSTSDPIGKHLAGVPADKQAITIHHLLTHTSGLTQANNILAGESFTDRDARVRQLLAAPLRFEPGKQFEYNNAGYTLAAAIVELASGQSYQRFVYEQLLAPAGMTRTGFHVPGHPIPGWEKQTIARLYDGPQENGSPYGRVAFTWFVAGAGGFLTTPGDLFKWHLALSGDRILSAEAKRKLYTPNLGGYAYGWSVRTGSYGKVIGHGGGTTMGTGAYLERFTDAGVTIAFAMNNSGERFIENVRAALTRVAFGKEVAAPPAVLATAPAGMAGHAGRYRLESKGIAVVGVDGARLTLGAGDPAAFAELYGGQSSERYRGLAARTAAIVEALAKGDAEPLGKAFIRSGQGEQERRRWQQWRTEYGALLGATVLGTSPEPMDDAATNVRFDFERGTVYAQYVWFPRGLDEVRVLASAPGLTFLPASPTEFVDYDLATGATRRVVFVDGRLTLSAGGREVTAVRQ